MTRQPDGVKYSLHIVWLSKHFSWQKVKGEFRYIQLDVPLKHSKTTQLTFQNLFLTILLHSRVRCLPCLGAQNVYGVL